MIESDGWTSPASTTPTPAFSRESGPRIGLQGGLLGSLISVWLAVAPAWGDSQEPLGRVGTVATYVLTDTAGALRERPSWEGQQRLSVVAAQLQLGPLETIQRQA